jgi:hypothetical protein
MPAPERDDPRMGTGCDGVGFEAARVLVDGLDHPEGVCWDPVAGCLYAGGENGQIYGVELGTGDAQVVARAPGQVLGGEDLDVAVVAKLGRWHLTALELGLRGAPLHRPERWAFSAGPART